ncbi:Carrier domain-containing protein [Fusarium falciforme]|uniref:Carrier domain-containing protein n=1 Tax=Fusarium falciforme TaxID=195108 RepID=UPI00230118EF|nr:Carrier domain-containing protein [Fusarium falciforme]WAO96249.1 Carrier domain-containing protein [Fusarium falciforme]
MFSNATQQPQPIQRHDTPHGTINEASPYLLNGHGIDHVPLNGHNHDIQPSLNGNPTNTRPIAICGMALRLPGGIKNPEAFWDVLINGKDLQAPVPPTRWNAAGFTNKLGSRSSIAAQKGYFLSDDLSTLDTSFFTMSKRELERCDPQQRKLLEITREVLESAGETEFRGKPIGCYVGTFGEDWLQMSGKEDQHIGGYPLAAYGDLILANRISFEYDLKGPSMVIKTGCSASLVGLHEACRAIQSGDCSSAIVAGANLVMGPIPTSVMAGEGMLSPDGSCKTFDASANGYARGEAINALYIKPLDDAIRDNNPIRAVIRNTATNSDGKSQGILAPNGASHEALMRKVYGDIGLDPGKTAFVECHGTGTPTGDPIEATAVGNVFGQHGVYIGSVKPNTGHAEGASGITSIIKAVLALENNTIPPNIKFNNPNPKIPFDTKKLKVPTEPESWPEGRDKRVSVNSFGIGGSNAHVILDAPPSLSTQTETTSSPKLIVMSANTSESLKQYLSTAQDYLAQHPHNAADMAYTLAHHRQSFPHRAFMVVKADGSLVETSSPARAPSSAPGVVMVFNGQGAQWPEMGKQLFETDAYFREDVMKMNDILKSLMHPPSWNLQDELFAPRGHSRVHQAELSQPLCTALQAALVRHLQRAGIHPSGVIGHSSGEIAAAYAAGGISLEEAIIAAYYRGYVTKLQTLKGGMGAVGLGVDGVSKYIQDGIVIACDNSPESVTLSGDVEVLDKVLGTIKAENPDTLTRRLKVEIAYHSDHMKPLATQYKDLMEPELARRDLKRPATIDVPFFSSVTGKMITSGDSLGPDYWISNLTSRVRFTSAVSKALKDLPNSVFVEIGPHSTLSGPLRQISTAVGADYRYVSTLKRSGDSSYNLLSTFGHLHQKGVPLDWSAIAPKSRALTNLPSYAWDYSSGSFWYETRLSRESRFREFGHHRLLGLRNPHSSSLEPAWRNNLTLEDEPWLGDHMVGSDVVFPFAGYIAMAGEAIRQTTGISEGYRVQDATARSAMMLSDQPVEVVTTLRPVNLSDTSVFRWFTFTIVSHNGSSWTLHFEGQVKACNEALTPSLTPATSALVRPVASAGWYDALEHIGLVYGPEFQALEEIVTSATENLAVAKINNKSRQGDEAFLFHPAAMDNCLQLLLAATTRGLGRNFGQLRVPTSIDDLVVRRSSTSMDVVASAQSLDNLAVEVVTDGKVSLRLNGLQLTPVDDGQDQQQERHAAARLEWLPDFDLMNHKTLFSSTRSDLKEARMHEEMTLLCILETAEKVRNLEPGNWHFEKFRNWLNMEIDRARQGTYPVVEQSKDFAEMSSPQRRVMIDQYYETLVQSTTRAFFAVGLKAIYDNCEGIFTGEVDALETLMKDNVLAEIYNAVSFGKGDFLKLLAHSRPDLRILEVGAGTGGTTEMILRNLARPDGLPAYSVYTFSDISAGFFPQARERFHYAPNMDYRAFDISKDPFEQGFKANTYDVILAPNVIHATESLNKTLSNLQPLLRTGGLLVLTELCGVVRTPNYVFGNFSGWWLGEADGREWEPYVSVERWDHELKSAGFSGVDTAVLDAEEPFNYGAAVVSTKVENGKNPKAFVNTSSVSIITTEPESVLARKLTAELNECGMPTSMHSLPEAATLSPDADIISLVDLEIDFFQNTSQQQFKDFQDFLNSHKTGRVLWLTKPAQANCQDPQSSLSIGLARCIRAESQIPFHTLEIQPDESCFAGLVAKVLNKIRRTVDDGLLSPDREYIVDEGLVKIGRYQPLLVGQELKESSSAAAIDTSDDVKELFVSKRKLAWANETQPELGENEVVVDTHTVALSAGADSAVFKMEEDASLSHDLLQVAGMVSAVGPNVEGLAVGDRVLATATDCSIKTKMTCLESLAQKIPQSLDFEDAVAMAIPFTTAHESLINVGQLQKGQSVLIHPAATAIGQAAIQIAKFIGAKIYATAASQEEAEILDEAYGIDVGHIFTCHEDSLAATLKRETSNCGVDLVLHSVPGVSSQALRDCVADFGKMIDLGKTDSLGREPLTMRRFLKVRYCHGVNMAQLTRIRPQRMAELIRKSIQLFEDGLIEPIGSAVFEAVDIEKAFRQLRDEHVDNVVVRIPTDASTLSTTPRYTKLRMRSDASYLLTGGMGGLGVGISRWLVERGARSLVFLSRSAGQKPKDEAFIRELESCGCSVVTVAGQAQSMEDVQRAISLAPHPIRGVVHLAMVLRDNPIATMSYEDWTTTTAPKIQGAWNLHECLKAHDLDFMVMASSINTIVESPGQGNYSAANTFLEAFTQYRRSLSLPASVLNICAIEDVGYVAENAFAKKNIKSQGLYSLREKELLDFFELAIRLSPASTTTPDSSSRLVEETEVDHHAKLTQHHPWSSKGQVVMGLRSESDLNDTNTRTNWRRDRRMGFYHNYNRTKTTDQDESSNKLAEFLSSAADSPNILDEAATSAFLAREIGNKVFNLILKDAENLDTSLTLQQVGLDSLMAIELRRWWKLAFGLEISVLELMATGTMEALGTVAAKGLKGRLTSSG